MHREQQFQEFLFQQTGKASSNALRNYISSDDDLLDLPMQMINNPYTRNRPHHQNRPFYSRNNQSISKCAVTQVSSRPDDDYEESITPVCQKLFDHHTYSRIEKQFDLPQTMPSEQVITEATFKPCDLKEYLRGNNKEANSTKLKQILRENVFNQPPKQSKQTRSRVASAHISNRIEEAKQKTKYEKILEEYFNSKNKKEAIKSRLSQQKMPSIKVQYQIEQNRQIPIIKSQYTDELLRTRQKTNTNLMSRSRSEKQIAVSSNKNHNLAEKPILTKTFSQKQLKEKEKQVMKKEGKEVAEGWMRMSFQQRQQKTLQNRKNKQNLGQKHNQQQQVKNCTFKPNICDFKPVKQRPTVPGSYAQLYLEKIRRRL